jgi:hypothetical protein
MEFEDLIREVNGDAWASTLGGYVAHYDGAAWRLVAKLPFVVTRLSFAIFDSTPSRLWIAAEPRTIIASEKGILSSLPAITPGARSTAKPFTPVPTETPQPSSTPTPESVDSPHHPVILPRLEVSGWGGVDDCHSKRVS